MRSELTLLAFWDVREEQPSGLAERLAMTLESIDAAIGAEGAWLEVLSELHLVAPQAGDLEPLVAAGIDSDDSGQAFPAYGYRTAVMRRAASMTATVTMRAGRSAPGRRRPSNEIMVRIYPGESGGPSAEQVDRVVLAIAGSWEPASIAVRDRELTAADVARGRWDPLVGWRTWVSHDLGAIGETADGVRAEMTAGGTLLAVDDAFTAEQAVAAVRATFQRNGIGEMPHATPAPQGPRPLPS